MTSSRKLAAYTASPRELKITTFHALRSEQSRKKLLAESAEQTAEFQHKELATPSLNEEPAQPAETENQSAQINQAQSATDVASENVKENSSPPSETKFAPVFLEMDVYRPSNFYQRQKILQKCVSVGPMPSDDFKSKYLTTAVNNKVQYHPPLSRGVGKLQTWIYARPFGQRLRGERNLFDLDLRLAHPSAGLFPRAPLDGPPRLDHGWMGNTEAPNYRTDNRDSYKYELNRMRKPLEPPAVVRLGYGHTAALERHYQTSYAFDFCQ